MATELSSSSFLESGAAGAMPCDLAVRCADWTGCQPSEDWFRRAGCAENCKYKVLPV